MLVTSGKRCQVTHSVSMTGDNGPVLTQWWANVCDVGSSLSQHWTCDLAARLDRWGIATCKADVSTPSPQQSDGSMLGECLRCWPSAAPPRRDRDHDSAGLPADRDSHRHHGSVTNEPPRADLLAGCQNRRRACSRLHADRGKSSAPWRDGALYTWGNLTFNSHRSPGSPDHVMM